MKWHRISNNPRKMRKPEKYKKVLVVQSGNETSPPSVCVGYRNSHGDFITPGAAQKDASMVYWSDDLPEDFSCPLWSRN